MMHDPDTLASAYLDGDLTDDERLAAEADPAVMAAVEQLRVLRAGLADVEPPSDAAREAAIGAAMAAFHDQFAAAQPASAPSAPPAAPDRDAVVVPMWKRFTSPQWLGAAAAAVVVVVGVGVVSTIDTGSDDDSFDSAADEPAAEIMASDDAADEPADLPDADADRIAESEMADDVFAAEAEESADMEMSDEMADDAAAEEPAADAADDSGASADDGEMGAEMDGEMADGDGAFDAPPALDDPALHFDRDMPIVGPLQLRAAAWYLLDQREAGTLGATPEYRCEFYNVLGAALLDVDGEIREVLLEFDEADPTDRVVYAVARDGCLVVATIELDRP